MSFVKKVFPFLVCLTSLFVLLEVPHLTINAVDVSPISPERLQAWRETSFLTSQIPSYSFASNKDKTQGGWDLLPGEGMVWQEYNKTDTNWDIGFRYNAGFHDSGIFDPDPAHQLRPRLRPFSDDVVYTLEINESESELVKASFLERTRINLTNHPGRDDYHSWSSAGDLLYFASNRDGNWEIYQMDENGNAQTRLTQDPSPNLFPTASPDGTKLAWITYSSPSTGAIFVQDLITNAVVQLTPYLNFLQELVWSSDGSVLYYSYDSNGDFWFDLGKVNADGSAQGVLRYADYLTDLIPTSTYYGTSDLLWTRNEYEIVNTVPVLNYSRIERLYLPSGIVNEWFQAFGPAQNASEVFLDNQAPTATISAFPNYWTRAYPYFTMTWSVTDTGMVQPDSFDLQERTSGGEWATIFENYQEPSPWYVVPEQDGQLEYRIRGRDRAGNLGVWSSPTLPIQTFQFGIDAHISDNRGIGISSANALGTQVLGQTLSPIIGHYLTYFRYLNTSDPIEVDYTAHGYDTLPTYVFRPMQNSPIFTQFNTYLPASDDLIGNGSFEGTLNGWQFFNTTEEIYFVHTGNRAIDLRAFTSEGSRLQRQVSIPITHRNPTLTFAYNYQGDSSFPPLELMVDDGIQNTIASRTYPNRFGIFDIAWADLTPWSGETVTITFILSSNSTLSNHVLLDNITLSSWNTPVINSVFPSEIPDVFEPITITLTGTNFIPSLTVNLNDIEIPATVIDEHHARFTIPTSLAPSWYDLTIKNGVGIEYRWNGVIKVGNSLVLPNISRK